MEKFYNEEKCSVCGKTFPDFCLKKIHIGLFRKRWICEPCLFDIDFQQMMKDIYRKNKV